MAISDIFELMATLRLDSSDYERGLKTAEEQSSVFGDVLKANLVTKGIEVALAGFKKLTSASIGFIKQSTEAYGEYQQLVGGVDTLFGESSEKVMENAKNAFKTAGISANEYMDTVTSFSASLIQSTGRGEQKDITALKDTLDEEYAATKRSLKDQYDAARDYWNDRIKLVKGTAEKEALRDERDAALKELKRTNEDQLAALKAHNKEVVKETEAANNSSVTTAESLERAAELADVAIKDMSDKISVRLKHVEHYQWCENKKAVGNDCMRYSC